MIGCHIGDDEKENLSGPKPMFGFHDDGYMEKKDLIQSVPTVGYFGDTTNCYKMVTPGPNVLQKTRCYLIGHMQYANGRGWRDTVKNELDDRGIQFFDPYHKPFVHDIPEDENAHEEMLHWMETEQYDLVQHRMWEVRGYDLRLCDICDFFVAHLVPEIASWGSAEEIITVIREKKPLFLSIEGGKKKTPLWLMGVVPHKYIYNSITEVINCIKAIDDGIIKPNSDRWRLLKPEMR